MPTFTGSTTNFIQNLFLKEDRDSTILSKSFKKRDIDNRRYKK